MMAGRASVYLPVLALYLLTSTSAPAQTATPTSAEPAATHTATATYRPTRTPTPTLQLLGDRDGSAEDSIVELQQCVNCFLDFGPDIVGPNLCDICDLDHDGDTDISELQGIVNCFLDPEGPVCPHYSPYDAVCGDQMKEGSETCDDGNNYGGDGCAANCTTETDLILPFGDVATTQSHSVVQSSNFSLDLPITGSQVFTIGAPRQRAVQGADGFTNFDPGDLPFAAVNGKNRGLIEPIAVPGLVCACLRGVELQTCGGRLPSPDNLSEICTLDVFANLDPTVCPQNDPCKPVFGPDTALAGTMHCNGADDLDYEVVADSATGDTTIERRGGAVDLGGLALTFQALGFIMDAGTCATDNGDPNKGFDGIPCTDDDPLGSQGAPQLTVLTTGVASGLVLHANHQNSVNIDSTSNCGTDRCRTSASGAAKSCADLVNGDPAGVCMSGAFSLLAQPSTGDAVVPTRFCAIAPGP